MPKVLWSETKLYVVDQPTVRLYRELKEELGRPFGDSSVMEAVAHCIDRDPDFVREYLEANFELDAQSELPPQPKKVAGEGVGEEGAAGEAESEGADQDGEVKADEATAEGGEQGEGAEEEVEPDADEEEDDTPPKPEKPLKPKEPTFMDRYARGRGFRWHEGERCYTHASGAWIEKGESPFSWYEHVNGGEVTKRLFVEEATLVEGIEIPAELWRLMEINPDSIARVVCGEDGKPNEWSAGELQGLKAARQIHQIRRAHV